MDTSNSTPPEVIGREWRVDTVAEQVRAIDDLVALAQARIQVFDVDLAQGGWNTAERADALARFLRQRNARLDVIVHDTHWIEACGARVAALLARHSHAMTIYRTGERARSAMDPLLIVDDTHFVHRFHVDRVGGKLSIGDPERAKALVERFDEIWESGEPGVTGTVLGL